MIFYAEIFVVILTMLFAIFVLVVALLRQKRPNAASQFKIAFRLSPKHA